MNETAARDRSGTSSLVRRESAYTRSAAAGGLAAGLATATCCIVPFVLLSLGAGGAWLANLTALAPYQPYFIAAAVMLFGLGLWRARRRRPVLCEGESSVCASPASRRFLRVSIWISSILIVAGILFNYVGLWLVQS